MPLLMGQEALQEQGCRVAELVEHATRNGVRLTTALGNGTKYGVVKRSDEVPAMWGEWLHYASEGVIDADELEKLTVAVQQAVRLPFYSLRYASAWLGITEHGVRDAVNSGRLPYYRQGHDRIIFHEDLATYAVERAYTLTP